MKAILKECGYDSINVYKTGKAYYKFYGEDNTGRLDFDLLIRSNKMFDMFPNDGDYDIEIIIKKKPKPVDETIITIK